MVATAESKVDSTVDGLPVKYSVSDTKIAEIRDHASSLTADTKEGYEEVRKTIALTRTLRSEIEQKRVALKADALAWGRKVDTEARRLTNLLEEIEEPLKAKKKAIDDEKERVRKQKEEEERRRVEEELARKRAEEEAKLKAQREAEEARIREEQAKLAEERRKLEEARKAEEARQKVEREKMEAERKAMEEAQRIEREKIEEERRAVQAEKERQERIAFEREAKEKAEREAREKVERERIAAEEKAKADAEAKQVREESEEKERQRVLAMRPDVEKVQEYAKSLHAFMLSSLPQFEHNSTLVFVEKKVAAITDICIELENFKP